MPDRQIAGERLKREFVENLVHQAHALGEPDFRSVAYRQSGGFLASVLEGKKSEKCDACGLLLGSVDSEYAALFFRAVIELDVVHWNSISDGRVKDARPINVVEAPINESGARLIDVVPLSV